MTDMETVIKIEEELFTPALQKGFEQAKENGNNKDDALMAAANAYVNMLVSLLGGNKQALGFLKNQVDFLESKV